ncbi:MAG TPA: hypothetical protein VFM59_00065, partial [Salinimicrobium sp.]|nr:hypothetical protein [Salinimicrobium sp.]
MKSTLLCFSLLFSMCVSSQTVVKKDSIEIASKISDWNQGWKTKNYLLATKWYAENAEFTNAFGHNCRSKNEIEKLLSEVFKLDFVMSGDSKVASQRFKQITPDVILVITQIERAGQKDPEGKEIGMRYTNHHRLFQ